MFVFINWIARNLYEKVFIYITTKIIFMIIYILVYPGHQKWWRYFLIIYIEIGLCEVNISEYIDLKVSHVSLWFILKCCIQTKHLWNTDVANIYV